MAYCQQVRVVGSRKDSIINRIRLSEFHSSVRARGARCMLGAHTPSCWLLYLIHIEGSCALPH